MRDSRLPIDENGGSGNRRARLIAGTDDDPAITGGERLDCRQGQSQNQNRDDSHSGVRAGVLLQNHLMTRTLAITVPGGFRLPIAVRSHGWYLLAPFHWNERDETLERFDTAGRGKVSRITVVQKGRSLHVTAAPSMAEGELRRRITRMLQLDVDLSGFHAQCRRVPSHGKAATSGFGRLLCGTTRFEDTVKVITTTNTTWRQTVRMNELLCQHFGRRGSGGNAFPSPDDIAASDVGDLQDRARLGYRAKTIHQLAKLIVSGELDIEADVSAMPTAELEKELRRLPGIGPYGSAHLLAMEGRHDLIAVDTEFRRFVRERYFEGVQPSDARMLDIYDQWGRWKYLGYWWELWTEVAESVDRNGNTPPA